MTKGTETKKLILQAGVAMASRYGLDGVSIGELAKQTGMSKSGLFAHFGSKEKLLIAILEFAGEDFTLRVVVPALAEKAGQARFRMVAANWIRISSNMNGGCIFVTAGTDFNDRPGKVRDYLVDQQLQWLDSLNRMALSAIKAGDFRESIDTRQFAYEFYSLLLGFHMYHTLLKTEDTADRQQTALDKLLESYK